MTTITFEIALILVLTIVNGVFAMSEVALLSARAQRPASTTCRAGRCTLTKHANNSEQGQAW